MPEHTADTFEREARDDATASCGCGGACNGSGPDTAELDDAPGTSRRQFLKVLGVGGAGAATVACGPPNFADKLIPNLVQEEGITPGVNETYATVITDAGPEPLAVHATVRDGRVLKLEPNSRLGSGNGLTALAQSTLQDLYDPDRVQNPKRSNGDGTYADASWDEAIAALSSAVQGGGAVLLTGAVTGTGARFLSEWAAATGAEHIAWEPFGNEALTAGRDNAALPHYALGAADRIVCFGADFLGTWLSPSDLARGFAVSRDIDGSGHPHAKFTFVGPRLGLTGSNADEWVEARAGTEGQVAMAVANVVAAARGVSLPSGASYTPDAVAAATGVSAEAIRALGEDLAAAEAAVAIPPGIESQGADAAAAHRAVAMLNLALGATGVRVHDQGGPADGTTASFADMQALIARMAGGQVGTLILAGGNPAFALPASAGFVAAAGNVQNVIALSSHMDESAYRASWVLPCSHDLESWGDAELPSGTMGLGQPAMAPVFDTRQREDILLAAAGQDLGAPDYATYLKNAWLARVGDEAGWLDALRRGGVDAVPAGDDATDPTDTAAAAATASVSFSQGAGSGTQVVMYPTVQYYDGRGANRSWQQEMPDPITKSVWTTWVEMHPDMADQLGVRNGHIVRVESGAGAIEAPAFVYEGIRADTVAIPIGQGHTAYGRNAAGRGANPLDLLAANADAGSGALAFAGTDVTVTATGARGRLVLTQGSHDDLGREIAEIMNVDDALHEIEEHEVDLLSMVRAAHDSDPASPYRWGMVIDLNACTGCGACVTACYAENNIPTVGEELVAQRREMSWMRVHSFHERTDDGGFQTVHQPMLCQHCGDAPCEPVCPVYATYHNGEGLNVQVYNRCVGTRYCSNNCPYKVRRFNWFTYEFAYPLNLQLNPDITVREKGVMDKCSFCVHRINSARLDAKDEDRLIRDGEVQSACSQGCPTQAITFGNLKDPNSAVSRKAKSARGYHALDELGVRPGITYLEDVTHAHLAATGHGDETAADGGESH